MNYRMICRILSRVLTLEAALMLLPLIVALIYGESVGCFLYSILVCAALALALRLVKLRRSDLYAREGFVSVGLSWMIMSLVGALPFFISGEIPSYVDALFEVVSAFSTTGASILTNVEAMSYGLLFWRSLAQWIGGMGVLVFIMAVMPLSDDHSMHIMRAEATGPVVGKLVPKMRNSSAISYLMYIGLTLVLVIFLICGDMPVYDSIVHALSTASTGGFSTRAASVGYYQSAYIDIVLGVFMLLFGVNFNIYFLMLMRKFKSAFTNRELICYLGIVAFSTLTIAANISSLYGGFGTSLRYSFFQVSSLMTTSGFATANFDLWPSYSKCLLVLLMFIGGCAGSTGGGMKVSRIMILMKAGAQEIRHMLSPRRTVSVRIGGASVAPETVRCTLVFFFIYLALILGGTLVVSLDGFDPLANFTAVVSCVSNIGPGLGMVGPMGSFAAFSDPVKLFLSLCMLIGRLELFPILLLFVPDTWRRT